MLRQQPGPENALGRVKFMFPNPYAVYLHDTPSKALFEKSERAFSSGCIRIENPFELAELVLDDPAKWSRAEIERVVEAGKMRSVTLAKPIPVLLSYWTAWVDRSGVLHSIASSRSVRGAFRPSWTMMLSSSSSLAYGTSTRRMNRPASAASTPAS